MSERESGEGRRVEVLPAAQQDSAWERVRPDGGGAAAAGANGGEPREGDTRRSPSPPWKWWTAFLALAGGLLFAALGAIVVDVPALLAGVKITESHTPAGITLADTFVQDVGFVLVAVWLAHWGLRKVRSWQFGLRRPGIGWLSAIGFVLLLMVLILVVNAVWSEAVSPEKEKLLEELGSNEGTAMLLLSAGLTCVVAPICEEFLFRGYIFTALRNWRGTLPAALITGLIFGGVHAGSAPALDLLPLACLGFGLCLLYRYTGSLYPCIVTHALNNVIAFSGLEHWHLREGLLLMVCSLATIWALATLFRRVGLISGPSRALAG